MPFTTKGHIDYLRNVALIDDPDTLIGTRVQYLYCVPPPPTMKDLTIGGLPGYLVKITRPSPTDQRFIVDIAFDTPHNGLFIVHEDLDVVLDIKQYGNDARKTLDDIALSEKHPDRIGQISDVSREILQKLADSGLSLVEAKNYQEIVSTIYGEKGN